MNEQLKQRINEIKTTCHATYWRNADQYQPVFRALIASIEIFELLHAWAALEDIANAWEGKTE